jgi:hypothetical protein
MYLPVPVLFSFKNGSTAVDSIADQLLMPLSHCFGYVFKALDPVSKILEVVVFAFESHTP